MAILGYQTLPRKPRVLSTEVLVALVLLTAVVRGRLAWPIMSFLGLCEGRCEGLRMAWCLCALRQASSSYISNVFIGSFTV